MTLTGNTKQTDRLIELLSPLVNPLGYEIVAVEVQTHRQKTLRVFIDHLTSNQGIGIEDCVKVTRALDEPLDQMPEIEPIFGGAFELEVSSPGVDRPLRQAKDFVRFTGREIRLHVYRALSAEELANIAYHSKNPKQKNFVGTLLGMKGESVLLSPSKMDGNPGKKSKGKAKSKKAVPESAEEERIEIPFTLISKANLEPNFDDLNDEKKPAATEVELDLASDARPGLAQAVDSNRGAASDSLPEEARGKKEGRNV